MYGNNKFSDCGPTEVANDRRHIVHFYGADAVGGIPTQDDVYDLYRRSGNPNFDPNKEPWDPGQQDNGVNMQDMLNEVRKNGIGGVKCVAFAEVNVRNPDELRTAIAIFGGLHYGVDLKVAQQAQTTLWNYVANQDDWGGHAIFGGAYIKANGIWKFFTWAQTVAMTDAFRAQQLEEAWVVVWPEHLKSQHFLANIDIAALADAFHQLTGQTLPLPTPAPSPAPAPATDNPFQAVVDDAVVMARVTRAANLRSLTPGEWARRHFITYFGIKE
jgi:hypothetical protein